MPSISVVMPAYNAGKYIGEAIESVINQTFSDWELIIVNDGSTDNTLEIIKKYADSEPRIHYHSISNSGSARKPRRIAISLAKGDWIVALDADDYLEKDDLEKLYARARTTGAEIVIQRMVGINDGKQELFSIPAASFDFGQILTGKEACALTIGGWTIGAAGCLVKKELFDNLFEKSPKGEELMNLDEIDTRRLFLSARQIAFCDVNYYYRMHENSITHQFSVKRFDVLKTNQMLRLLVDENYEFQHPIREKMQCTQLRGIAGCQAFYFRHRRKMNLSADRKIQGLILEAYKEVKMMDTSGIPWWMKLILLSHYRLFLSVTFLYSLLK